MEARAAGETVLNSAHQLASSVARHGPDLGQERLLFDSVVTVEAAHLLDQVLFDGDVFGGARGHRVAGSEINPDG